MTSEELEGRYESEATKGPGTRYNLELGGKSRADFRLVEAAWMLGRGAAELIGERVLEGTFSLADGVVVLRAQRQTDLPAGRPAPPSVPVPSSLELRAEVLAGERPALRLAIHGRAVPLLRAD